MELYVLAYLPLVAALLAQQGFPTQTHSLPRAMDNITVREGSTATLRCPLDDQVTRVAWLNRSAIMFAGSERWTQDQRVVLVARNSAEYTVHIERVTPSDEGPYTCSLQTLLAPRTSQVHVVVQVPPKIYNVSDDVSVNEGSNVSLVCLASGRPEPIISWRHLASTARDFDEGEILDIVSVTREQAGKYECSAANEVAAPDMRSVRLVVRYRPTIVDVQSMDGRNTGKSLSLRCEAAAVPAAIFTWYKDQQNLRDGWQGVSIANSGSHSLLIFKNVTDDSYGNYTCEARNAMGQSSASLHLYKAIASTFPTQVKVSLNKAATPPTSVVWLLLSALFILLM
uniref:limbic system-associated membrane protein-like isoform X2 n=1 Tax=Myxine glutinosa TaxID=7769 RepID=UPI00358F97B3